MSITLSLFLCGLRGNCALILPISILLLKLTAIIGKECFMCHKLSGICPSYTSSLHPVKTYVLLLQLSSHPFVHLFYSHHPLSSIYPSLPP